MKNRLWFSGLLCAAALASSQAKAVDCDAEIAKGQKQYKADVAQGIDHKDEMSEYDNVTILKAITAGGQCGSAGCDVASSDAKWITAKAKALSVLVMLQRKAPASPGQETIVGGAKGCKKDHTCETRGSYPTTSRELNPNIPYTYRLTDEGPNAQGKMTTMVWDISWNALRNGAKLMVKSDYKPSEKAIEMYIDSKLPDGCLLSNIPKSQGAGVGEATASAVGASYDQEAKIKKADDRVESILDKVSSAFQGF